jgi:hypothetical protein
MKKITDFKVVFICPDHNEKYNARKQHMYNLLNTIGFTNIEHFKSGTENYPTCLNMATIHILENNLDIPVLIVEDDIEWTGILEIDYNEQSDAVYLGISKSGGHPTLNYHCEDGSKFEKWSDTQVRVINMLSGHAIVYNTRKYKEAVINILKINLTYYNDVLFTRLQKDYLILANKKPVFYQSATFNKGDAEEFMTNFIIDI